MTDEKETKSRSRLITAVVIGVAVASGIAGSLASSSQEPEVLIPKPVLRVATYAETQEAKLQKNREYLTRYTTQLMEMVESKTSKKDKTNITKSIVDVSTKIFTTVEEMKMFAILISIESKFNHKAVSDSGATGLTQVMPKYAEYFVKNCSIKVPSLKNLKDVNTNLTVGACHFKMLLDTLGSPTLAIVAYNAGQYSDQIKQIKTLRNMENTETASYVVKFNFLKEKMEKR
jgi:hypothetical protein